MPEPRSENLRRTAFFIWALVGAGVLGWGVLKLVGAVEIIWLPLIFAAGLVLLLNPLVEFLVRRRTPRVVAAFLALGFLIGLIVVGIVLLAPVVREQAAQFATSLPNLWNNIIVWVNDLGERFGVDLAPPSFETIQQWIQDPANQETIQNLISTLGVGAGRLLAGVAHAGAVTILAPLLALYLLIDLPRTKALAYELTPPRHRPEASYVAGQLGTAMGSFVRGQLMVAVVVGTLSSIGMALIDLPFFLIVGILAGVLNLIPFAGPIVGGALAAIIALLNGDVTQAIWAVAIMIGIQQLDNHLITPLVQRTRVKLSPVVIVLALILGGALAGLVGVLIAVPLVAAVRIVVGHFWRTRMLGESWEEASEAAIEITPPPERIAGLRRRDPTDQQKLFDTAEQPVPVAEEPTPVAEVTK
jgi:predicted PurR-regulated permease PerM